MKNKILYFLQDMWICDWKPAAKLSLLWLATSFIVEDAVHGWYDIDWLVVIVGFVFIFVLRLIVPSFYYLFSEDDIKNFPEEIKVETYESNLNWGGKSPTFVEDYEPTFTVSEFMEEKRGGDGTGQR